jgi:hypothetical protein
LRRYVNRFALFDEVGGTKPRQILVKHKDKQTLKVSPLRGSGSTRPESRGLKISKVR